MGGIRIFLALAVVIAHAGGGQLPLIDGAGAVQIFYIISGFYVSLVLTEKYGTERTLNLPFWRARLVRIYPSYLIVLLVTVASALMLARGGETIPPLAKWNGLSQEDYWFWPRLLLTNILIWGQDQTLFWGADFATEQFYFSPNFGSLEDPLWSYLFVPQAWTLSLELTFYLMAPFLVSKKTRILLALAVASLICRILFYYYATHVDPWSYRFFPFEIALFTLGVLSHRWYAAETKSETRLSGYCLVLIMLVAIVLFDWWVELVGLPSMLMKWCVYGLMVISLPSMFRATKNSLIDRYLGEISYEIYICHMLVIWVLGLFFEVGSGKSVFAACLFSMFLAIIVKYGVTQLLRRSVIMGK